MSDETFKEHVVNALANLATRFAKMDRRMNRIEGKLDEVAATCEDNRQALERIRNAFQQEESVV